MEHVRIALIGMGVVALMSCAPRTHRTSIGNSEPVRSEITAEVAKPGKPEPAGPAGLPPNLPPAPALAKYFSPPPECPIDANGHDGTDVCSPWVFSFCETFGHVVKFRRLRNCDPAYQCRTSDDNPDGTAPDPVEGGTVVNCSNPPAPQTPAPAPAVPCPAESLSLPSGCLYRGGGDVINGCSSLGQILCRSAVRTTGNQVLTVGNSQYPFSAGSTIEVDSGNDIPLVVNAPIEVTLYAVAGGGGGAGGAASDANAAPGGGGGGGAVNSTGYTLLLLPGVVYYLDVGAAGKAGAPKKNGTPGSETSFRSADGTVYFYFAGGNQGFVGGNGGKPGFVGMGFGQAGGQGGALSIAGRGTNQGQGVGVPGGGGGGGAGNYSGYGGANPGGAGGNSGSPGAPGSGGLGGASAEGGAGGDGGGVSIPGISGTWGAGGGGAGGSITTSYAGKNGQPGVIAIKFVTVQ